MDQGIGVLEWWSNGVLILKFSASLILSSRALIRKHQISTCNPHLEGAMWNSLGYPTDLV
jgi:hypothetical protein